MRNKLKTLAIYSGAALVILVGTSACFYFIPQSEGNNSPPETEDIVRPVPTVHVKEIANTQVREFPGTVRATQRVELAFSVTGKLEELNAPEGRVFEKGEVIARLDQRDFRNDVAIAKARLNELEKDVNRKKALLKKAVIPLSEYERIEAQYDVAVADMSIREKALEDTVIRAPFRGVVAARHVENHEHIDARVPILSFQDVSRIEVVFQAPEQLMLEGGTENLHNYRVKYQTEQDDWRKMELSEYRVAADPLTRTYDVILTHEPPTDLHVLPGMTVRVAFEAPHHVPDTKSDSDHTLAVPLEAVFSPGDGSSYVWVIGDSGGSHPLRAKVELGSIREDGVEVLRGLQANQLVAVSGVGSLDESMLVRPMKPGREGLEG